MRTQRLDRARANATRAGLASSSIGIFLRLSVLLTTLIHRCQAFVAVSPSLSRVATSYNRSYSIDTSLFLAKKKRRRRKVPPTTAVDADATVATETKTTPSPSTSVAASEAAKGPTTVTSDASAAATDAPSAKSAPSKDDTTTTSEELAAFRQVANFAFQPETDPTQKVPIVDGIVPDRVAVVVDNDNDMQSNDLTASQAIPLPDIRQARRMKQAEQQKREAEMGNKNRKQKIKRSDTAAFTKLLEQEPFADADDSFFEEEEYGTVSALLGERAKPFLGIPLGPLQVGHFIGSLGIVLMAFVEYPGFPLTNLPTPLRECFQGGLLTVYAINTVLAVLAAFKAPERGQPIPLWAAKTFAVGGLAYDQLLQLPTTAAMEKAKAVKGKRAINKRR